MPFIIQHNDDVGISLGILLESQSVLFVDNVIRVVIHVDVVGDFEKKFYTK